ncbi:alpha/beta hydrolase [Caballeronia sp. J97]|uniref:alpha/beta fold hydrolase n=1 Tax=Caballeronia sp. J97 TaxID=2805429 RepID=UPI002AAFF936|nr:alpha/beta hydrolase [Caballeronia sp. J97]
MSVVTGKPVVLTAEASASADARRGGSVPQLYLSARYCATNCDKLVAFVLCHPAGDFTKHYLLPYLEKHGGACLGLATRFVNNELELTMEQCIQDLGLAVAFLRAQGFEKVVLVGNSGGGSLSSLYQAEAEKPSITTYPDGESFVMGALGEADAIILLSAHPGRAEALTSYLDPAIFDETNPTLRNPDLDLFVERHVPFDRDWLARYRAAQIARNRRLSEHALSALSALRRQVSGPRDQIMIIHGTGADPAFIDVTLDPNGRKARDLELTRRLNDSHLSMGRVSTMRSWLSQWSIDYTRADGPARMGETNVPVLAISYGNDELVLPSQMQRYVDAAAGRSEFEILEGASHFMVGQESLKDLLAERLVRWARTSL